MSDGEPNDTAGNSLAGSVQPPERKPNIIFFPDVLFQSDQEAISRLKDTAPVLGDTPMYQASALTQGLDNHRDLISVWENLGGPTKTADRMVMRPVAAGTNGGIVFRLNMGGRDMSLKLFYHAPGARAVAEQLLSYGSLDEEAKKSLLSRYSRVVPESRFLSEMAAFTLVQDYQYVSFTDKSQIIRGSEFVPDLICGWTDEQHHVIGYSLPFIPGDAMPLDDAINALPPSQQDRFYELEQRMGRIGIQFDHFFEANNGIKTNDGLQVVDLHYEGPLDHHPAECDDDETYMEAHSPTEVIGIVLKPYSEYAKDFDAVSSTYAAEKRTFASTDVFEGKAKIVKKSEYDTFVKSRAHFEQCTEKLRKSNIQFDKDGVHIAFGNSGMVVSRKERVEHTEETSRSIQEHEIRGSLDRDESGALYYQRYYRSTSNIELTRASNEDKWKTASQQRDHESIEIEDGTLICEKGKKRFIFSTGENGHRYEENDEEKQISYEEFVRMIQDEFGLVLSRTDTIQAWSDQIAGKLEHTI